MRSVLPFAIFLAVQAAAAPAVAQQPRPSGAQPPKDLIERGRALYDDQQYEESIQTLSGALVRSTNTTAQKIEIDRLLALDHITLGHKEEAENFVRALLALQPDYELPKSESPRFRDFFTQARARWEADGRPGLVTEQKPPAPVTMKHASPSEAAPGDEVTLTATVDDPDHRTKAVALFYRTGSAGAFTEVSAQFAPADGSVRATVPPRAVQPPYVAYYFQATDTGGVPVASRGDADAPLRIPVPDRSKGWILPVAVGGGVVGAAGIVLGSLAIAGVFKGGGGGGGSKAMSTVSVGVMSFR
jgi:hypothetical protein